ncbi:Por secretion system C-terminal sorting domain-containing protein [Lishizhenia tianjinensis]|uniref:Por secretion system C-terminal sorting domain-containing protein n=1 Tax=Lishizhenia tianjinensis TaxID=477690 RepID=A0A1I7AIB2_9FLAO|nr:T9SS type A sorting domain-containing protein [Lishizhenia tianjinensis]SFT74676.1 Por secretion system C-terminal sorting domain-containing protein [Lishizhenia tianjinensis]
MKIFYATAMALALSITALAQDFTYPIEQHWVATVTNPNFQGYDIDINTPSPEAIQYNWELISNTFPSAWSYSLCDYGGCAVGIPSSGSMNPISLSEAENGVKGWFKLNLTTGSTAGTGKVEIYVYDSNDYSRGDTVSWEISWDPQTAAIENNESTEISMFPNPANDQVTINGIGDYTATIYNSLGAEALSIEGKENTPFDVSSLESGVYIVAIKTSTDEVLTKRLVIK